MSAAWPIWMDGLQRSCTFTASCSCSCQISPQAYSPVILSTGLNGNAESMLAGEGLPMMLLSIIRRLSCYRFVVISLLIEALWWFPRGGFSLVFEYYHVLFAWSQKLLLLLNLYLRPWRFVGKRSKYLQCSVYKHIPFLFAYHFGTFSVGISYNVLDLWTG